MRAGTISNSTLSPHLVADEAVFLEISFFSLCFKILIIESNQIIYGISRITSSV